MILNYLALVELVIVCSECGNHLHVLVNENQEIEVDPCSACLNRGKCEWEI